MKRIYLLLFVFSSTFTFGQLTTHTFDFDGISRFYNLYIPTTYNSNTDTLPMVLFLHGMGGNMGNFSGLSYKAEAEKYIMVVPQGVIDALTSQSSWHSGAGGTISGITYYPNATIDDVGFINSLIDSVSSDYNIDEDRIYSTGFSMGGFMTNRLGCELGDRIAAIASVAGTIGNEILNSCNPDNIIPSLHIHSKDDEVVPYSNNTYGNDAEDLISFWLNNNNCDVIPDTTILTDIANDGYTAVKYLYSGGDLGSEVEFYELGGPLHNETFYFVNSGNDFDDIEVIWDFFSRHSNKTKTVEPLPNKITNILEATSDIFPNPASNKITLEFSNKVEISSIVISNALGKTIDSKSYDEPISESVFDISDRSPGIYFFQIKDIEGNMNVLRFYKK